MSSALIGLIVPLLIFAMLAVLVFPVIWRTLTPPRKGVKAPSCEKCRYPVVGNTTLICPECGTDFRFTGIITRPMEMRRRGHLFGALLAWTFLVLLVAYVTLAVLWATVGSSAAVARAGARTTSVTSFTPASSAYQRIELSQMLGVMGGPINLSLKLNDGTECKLQVITTADSANITDPAGLETARPYDEKLIPAWFAAAGVSTDDPVVAIEMRDIERATDFAGAGGWSLSTVRLNKLSAGSPTYSTSPSPSAPVSGWAALGWLTPAILGVMFVIWVLGIVAIVLRRRKLMREAKAADTRAALPTPSAPISAT